MTPQRLDRLLDGIARFAVGPGAFPATGATVLIWALAGPLLDLSEPWQWLFNTVMTVLAFLVAWPRSGDRLVLRTPPDPHRHVQQVPAQRG